MANLIMSRTLVMLVLTLLLITTINRVNANECLNFISNNVIYVNDLKLCESSYNGIPDIYSCQDYQSADKTYRVLYQGGVLPKAIIALNEQQHEQLIWSTLFGDKKLHCPLIAPQGIHIHAKHRGTGICTNNKGQNVACSIYEHKASRRIESHRYLVFYPASESKNNKIEVETFIFDATKDVMTAEITYQFGLSLIDTHCCSQQAMLYLEYAAHLYPKANKYSKAYNNAKFNLSVLKTRSNKLK